MHRCDLNLGVQTNSEHFVRFIYVFLFPKCLQVVTKCTIDLDYFTITLMTFSVIKQQKAHIGWQEKTRYKKKSNTNGQQIKYKSAFCFLFYLTNTQHSEYEYVVYPSNAFTLQVFYSVSFLQKGNWADRSCDEKHAFICMKQSATEPTGDEVEVDIGCKVVSEIYM